MAKAPSKKTAGGFVVANCTIYGGTPEKPAQWTRGDAVSAEILGLSGEEFEALVVRGTVVATGSVAASDEPDAE